MFVETTAHPPAPAAQEQPDKVRILVIDDERSLRQTIVAVLEYAGYSVRGAGDGFAGIRLAEEFQPNMIISDILMPGMDGYDLLRALRANPQTAAIPVIFVTAVAEQQAMRQGMALGADDYLIKPFKPDDLLKAVEVRLQRQAALQEKHDTTLKILRTNIMYALPHEMRTPLHLILGFAQMLEMNHASATGADIVQATGAIIKAGQRLERLVENYLVYAQLEVLASDPAEIQALRNHLTSDVDQVIAGAACQQSATVNRSQDLAVDLCPAALRIAEESLTRIVLELVENACKFSEPGTPVRLTSILEDNNYRLSISDSGRGMSADEIKRIGAYMQFGRAFHEQQGLGLGLVIVRRLAELHGGQIEIKSTVGKGTEVRVYLPLN
jgi:two-component system, sensor histidine kinase and response regulator